MAVPRSRAQIEDPNLAGTWRTQGYSGPTPRQEITGVDQTVGGGDYDINVSQKNKLLNSFMSPEAIAAIASGGLGFAGNLMNQKADSKENALDRDLEMKRLLSGIFADEQTDMRTRQLGYLNSTQMDPVSQSRDLFSANLLRDVAGRGPLNINAQQGITNPMSVSPETMGYLAPSALAETAGRFYGAAGSIDPSQTRPNLSAMGFGDAGATAQAGMDATITQAGNRYNDLNKQRRDNLLNMITAQQAGGAQQQQQQQGTSKKRKFLGILGAVGAGVAAPFTGGASLAAIGPALQLGYGAGSKTAMIGGLAGGMAAGAGMGQSFGHGGADYFKRTPGGNI